MDFTIYDGSKILNIHVDQPKPEYNLNMVKKKIN